MFVKKITLALAVLIISNFSFANEQIPLEKLFCYGESSGGSLSPSGRYYAAMVPSSAVDCSIDKPADNESISVLIVIDLENGLESKQMSGTSMNARIGTFSWLNDEQLLIQRSCMADYLDCNSLYTLNVDSGKRGTLLKVKSSKSGDGIKYGAVYNLMPKFKNKILVTINRQATFTYRFRDLYWLDINTKKLTKIAEVPSIDGEQFGNWMIDNDGNARGFTTSDDKYNDGKPNSPSDGIYESIYYMDVDSEEYTKISYCRHQEPCFMPLGSSPFDFDNRHMYGVGQAVYADGSVYEVTDTNAVWLFDTKNMKFVEKVFHDPEYDFSNPRQGSGSGYIIKDQLTETILGLSYYTSKREYIYFDQAYANLRTSVESTFPGMQISMNANDDFSKVIINTSSPTNPNTTYFYNVSKGSIEFIDQYAPWLSEYALGTTEPFKFVTRDGLKMNGYISLPPGYKKGKKIPFIVHPHGGPNARDTIGYSPEIQVYTTRGYGVIQVNYRGSVGFGLKQMKLANKKWSLTMHDDLLDGLFWARDEGYVDMDKVCISGASYGGYSAMVGITKNPDIFKCAINYVGVVDLVTLMSDKQWMFSNMGRPQQHIEMGNPEFDEDLMYKASPVHYVDNIKGELFVIHGRKDRQASYQQVLELKAALEEAGVPFEYMIKGDEGHGFYSEVNNLELYQRMESFLAKSLN